MGVLRWTLTAVLFFLALLLFREVGDPRPDPENILTILIVGGAAVLWMHRGIRTLVRSRPHRLRRAVIEASLRDPRFGQAPSRGVLLEFLLDPDRRHLNLFPWGSRLPDLLMEVIDRLLSEMEPQKALEGALERCILMLAEGRRVWVRRSSTDGARYPENQQEEDPTQMHQILLIVVILITSLYRLHLILWGRPPRAISRRQLGRLRRNWLPFCLLVPTFRNFPPEILHPQGSRPRGGPWRDAEEALREWIHGKGPDAEERFAELLWSPSPSGVAPGEGRRGHRREVP